MHTVLKDGDKITGVLCIERQIGTCIILQASLDEADALIAIARSQKVNHITVLIPENQVEEMKARGWSLQNGVKVMAKKL